MTNFNKYFIYIFILLVLSGNCKLEGQSFQTILDNEDWIFGISIIELAEEERFVLVGKSAGNGVQPQVRLYFIDSSGCVEEQVQHFIGDEGPEGVGVVSPDIIKRTSDGGFIVCGDQYLIEQGNHDGFLLKLNGQGEFEWHITHGYSDWEETWDVIELEDGSFITVGNTESFSEDLNTKSGYLAKFSSSGELLVQTTLPVVEGINQILFDAEYSNNQILVSSNVPCCIDGQNPFNEMIIFDTNLSLLSRHKYVEGPIELGNPRFNSTQDGGYIATKLLLLNNVNFDAGIIKLDSEFNVVWERDIDIGPMEGRDSPRGAVELVDETYMLIGKYENELTGVIDRERCFIAKYSHEGEFLWEQNYTFNDEVRTTEVRQAIATADGGAILAGFVRWQDNCICPWICKVDASGNDFFPLEIVNEIQTIEISKGTEIDLTGLDMFAIHGRPCYDISWSCPDCPGSVDEGLLATGTFISDEVGEFEIVYTAVDQNDNSAESSFQILVVPGTGIEDEFLEFGIYPNPVIDILYFQNPNDENFDFELFDSIGRILKVDHNNQRIDLSGFETGVFIINVVKDNLTIRSYKLIKI